MTFWNALGANARVALSQQLADMNTFCEATHSARYVLLERGNLEVLGVDASRLHPVPDAYFEHEPWLAPQLLPIRGPEDQLLLQEALACAIVTAPDRLNMQPVSAVLVGTPRPVALLTHFAALGEQCDPTEHAAQPRVFRYQDPRVMQRVWPALNGSQRSAWLGPVRRWYAALQPSNGSLGAETITKVVPTTSPLVWRGDAEPVPPEQAVPVRQRHMLDVAQWHLAHSAPAENAFWHLLRSSADAERPANPDPTPELLRSWLHQAAARGLHSADQTDWALCCWAAGIQEWDSALSQRHVEQAIALQRAHARLGFADALRSVRQNEKQSAVPPHHS